MNLFQKHTSISQIIFLSFTHLKLYAYLFVYIFKCHAATTTEFKNSKYFSQRIKKKIKICCRSLIRLIPISVTESFELNRFCVYVEVTFLSRDTCNEKILFLLNVLKWVVDLGDVYIGFQGI